VAVAYDLILLLDSTADDEARAKVLRDVETAITQAGGSLAGTQDWGKKTLAYKIRHKPDADYHLIQFTAPPTLPDRLGRALSINDTVLRHRIIHTPGGEEAQTRTPREPATQPAEA
jgi:small subunit ribosomal protein S6